MRSGQSAITGDIIGVSGATYTYKLVRFLYSAAHSLNLAALKIVAFLQLPALEHLVLHGLCYFWP